MPCSVYAKQQCSRLTRTVMCVTTQDDHFWTLNFPEAVASVVSGFLRQRKTKVDVLSDCAHTASTLKDGMPRIGLQLRPSPVLHVQRPKLTAPTAVTAA